MRARMFGTVIAMAGIMGASAVLSSGAVQAQAVDGASGYARDCARCHGDNLEGGEGPQLAGPGNGLSAYKNAAALLQYSMENMPNDQPSTLAPDEYAAVIGFILSKNGIAVPDGGLTPENGAAVIIP